MKHRKSTAKLWKGATRPSQKYRDRKTIKLPDGVSKEIFGYGPTKDAATDDLYKKIEREEQRHASANTLSVLQLIAKYIQSKKDNGRKRGTIHLDLQNTRLHIKPFLGHLPITLVELADVQGMVSSLTCQGKFVTAKHCLILLRGGYRYAAKLYRKQIREGSLRLYDPTEDLEPIVMPPKDTRKEVIWSPAQMNTFFTAASEEYDRGSSLFYPLYYLAVTAGLRRGELLGLRRKNVIKTTAKTGKVTHKVFIETQYIYRAKEYQQETPKTKQGTRHVPIPEHTYNLLQAHFAKCDALAKGTKGWRVDLAFPNQVGGIISPSNLRRSMIALMSKTGVIPVMFVSESKHRQRWVTEFKDTISVFKVYGVTGILEGQFGYAYFERSKRVWHVSAQMPEGIPEAVPEIRLHGMRKVFSTYLTRNMVNQGLFPPKILQQYLGHAKPDVAMDIYNKVIEEDAEKAIVDIEIIIKT